MASTNVSIHVLRCVRDAVNGDADTVVRSTNADFGSQPALQTELQRHIIDTVIGQTESNHDLDIFENKFVRAVYNADLNRFRKGIYGPLAATDPEAFQRHEIAELAKFVAHKATHLERSLKHLDYSARRKSVIVLDNIDQRSIEFQNEAFVIAQSLSSSLGATVFVSLRPSTFYDSKRRGSLAAYQPRAFLVSPPKVSQVVAKRLVFARKQLLEGSMEAGGVSLSVEDLLAYLDALELGFTKNETLIELLENLSGGNVRLALEFLSAFIGSGYVDTGWVLAVAASGGTYTIPGHEFLRSIIFGENDFYDPSSSRIVNLFDIFIGDESEHFLLPLLLALIHERGEAATGDSYVDAEQIFEVAQSWVFKPEQIQWHLNRAVEHKLLETAPGQETSGPYCITSIGAYMHKEMVTQFSYLDGMVVDTPILDPSIRASIRDVRGINDRLDRASLFKEYLDDIWERFTSPESLAFDWNVQGTRLASQMDEARWKACRAKDRRRAANEHED